MTVHQEKYIAIVETRSPIEFAKDVVDLEGRGFEPMSGRPWGRQSDGVYSAHYMNPAEANRAYEQVGAAGLPPVEAPALVMDADEDDGILARPLPAAAAQGVEVDRAYA